MLWIKKCLDSLQNNTVKTEIIIIDNASTDNTIAFIRSNYPTIQLIQQSKNLGFGKANNIGITIAIKNGAESVFLLNQDAYVEKNTLEKLVEISNANDAYGIISPMQFDWKGAQLEHYFELFASKNKNFYLDTLLKKELKPIYKVPFVNAAAWLLPRKTIEIIGGFDPIFHHYGEDNNYCQRVLFHGLKIGFVPNVVIFHDSKIRKGIKVALFSEAYYHDEQKQLQIKYADVNRSFNSKDRKAIKKHVLKLIVINLLKVKLKNVKGYLKKYRIFGKVFVKIEQSRKINQTIGPHYL